MPSPAVIAATDFTPRSAQVAGRAALIAKALGARLILAHALPEPAEPEPAEAMAAEGAQPPDGDPAPEKPGTLGRLARRLRLLPSVTSAPDALALLRAGARSTGPGTRVRLVYGPPGPALAQLAQEENARLLVLGLHRERRVLDLMRLTSMEHIVLEAAVPVLIAHRDHADNYRNVLGLTDFSPAAARALAMGGRIAPGAQFHAIHALQLPLGTRFSADDPAADAALTRAELLRDAFLGMADMPALAEPPEIVPGGVHEVLDFRQRELGAELVCIGTHSGRDPQQLGNYARDLMRAPPSDLLVAKPL